MNAITEKQRFKRMSGRGSGMAMAAVGAVSVVREESGRLDLLILFLQGKRTNKRLNGFENLIRNSFINICNRLEQYCFASV